MMNDSRSYASLSSGLLARKGAAKPAMRPQGYAGFEDLGWNDMGYDQTADQPAPSEIPEHVPSSIAALTPAPRPGESRHQPAFVDEHDESEDDHGQEAETADEEVPPVSERASEDDFSVVAQQRAILQRFEGEEDEPFDLDPAPEPIVPAKKPRAAKAEIVPLPKRATGAAAGRRKAAFTLRLDAERHLRLRLACAVTGRSAQHILTGALDAALAEIPEIEALAARVPAKAGSSGAKRN